MTPVDLILNGGTVITMDKQRHIFDPGAVAVRDKEIVAVGPAAALQETFQADQVWDCTDQIVMPGLVNTHTHAPMSLLRGLADDLRLDVWLYGYMLPTETRFVNPGFSRLGTLLACAEFIRAGVTCFADMYYFEDDVAWATVEAGLRGVCGQTVMNLPTPDATNYDESLAGSSLPVHVHRRALARNRAHGENLRCAAANSRGRDGPGSPGEH
jgi:5-methylthioadenosine/S-adenosylhomocysteine deaminase